MWGPVVRGGGAADVWGRDVSRRRKKKRRREDMGRIGPGGPRPGGGPVQHGRPLTRFLFLFRLHSTDTWVPPVGETQKLTSGPLDR